MCRRVLLFFLSPVISVLLFFAFLSNAPHLREGALITSRSEHGDGSISKEDAGLCSCIAPKWAPHVCFPDLVSSDILYRSIFNIALFGGPSRSDGYPESTIT